MSLSDLRAFELLLAQGASESKVDQFLDGLRTDPDETSKLLLAHFSKDHGLARDQLQFLSQLYTKGIHIDRCPGATAAFIFFSSLLDSMGAAGVRSRLSQMNAHCIYLYDDQLMNFALGIRQFGSGAQQIDAHLRQCVKDLAPSRIVTAGSSAAGFAAIKHAMSLDAHASVTFSPFTSFAEEHHQDDKRGQGVVDRFKKLAPELLVDLIPLLAKRDPPLKLVCFHGKVPRDVWHAGRIRSLKSAIAIALDVEMHNVLGPLVKNGMFEAFMRPLADGASVEESAALIWSRFRSGRPG